MKKPDIFADAKAVAANLRETIGLSASYASELASGKRSPSLDLAVKIERQLGIPTAAWLGRTETKRSKPTQQGRAA